MNLDDLFANAQSLPSIPEVVQELIENFDNDDFDFDDIAKKIALDQVITAKVLRVANSAKYGGNRTVASVNEAAVRVGFNTLKTLVMASGLSGSFKPAEGFDPKEFWLQTFEIAEVCKWLANYTDVEPDVAYTAGLISRIGRLLVAQEDPERAAEITRVVEKGGDRVGLEMDAWGFTSDHAGALLAKQWKFPDQIVDAIKWQSSPLDCEEDVKLPVIVCISRILCFFNRLGYSEEQVIEKFPGDFAQAAGIGLSSVLDNISEALNIDSPMAEMLD